MKEILERIVHDARREIENFLYSPHQQAIDSLLLLSKHEQASVRLHHLWEITQPKGVQVFRISQGLANISQVHHWLVVVPGQHSRFYALDEKSYQRLASQLKLKTTTPSLTEVFPPCDSLQEFLESFSSYSDDTIDQENITISSVHIGHTSDEFRNNYLELMPTRIGV